jgi:pimeloyl-ACP methyl ester carboxylesterase
VHDGVTLYYEVYGQGEPLLMIHGNGGSIGTMAAQIAFFRLALPRHRDGQPRSGQVGRQSPAEITYEKMTDDLAALLDHLKAGPGGRARAGATEASRRCCSASGIPRR